MLKDNRTLWIAGDIHQLSDIDDVFRELAAHFKIPIGEAKAKTKSQQVINMRSIQALCLHLSLRMEIDAFKGEFKIFYQPQDMEPCELTEQESESLEESPATEEPVAEKATVETSGERFKEIGSTEEEPEEELF